MTSPGPDMATQTDERLVNARAASQRHAWQDAFDAFTAADAESPLGGADLEALAEAAFFTANIDTRERSLERAVKSYTAEGDLARRAPWRSASRSIFCSRAGRRSHRPGVHVAARVAALAGANEILATQATLAETANADDSFQDVTLRGVSAPVKVGTIAWT